ncbi:carbon storage regulator CsrA [Paenibacillus tarimensis]
MLVLSRKKGESIIIQDDIEITILEVNADTVKIGINAPKEVEVLRKELYSMVRETNLEAAAPLTDLKALQDKLKNNKKNMQQL